MLVRNAPANAIPAIKDLLCWTDAERAASFLLNAGLRS
jgi:hypothetical protein